MRGMDIGIWRRERDVEKEELMVKPGRKGQVIRAVKQLGMNNSMSGG